VRRPEWTTRIWRVELARGEVKAFVELTRSFQHAAFGSALALIGDFQQAEDVVRLIRGVLQGLVSLRQQPSHQYWQRIYQFR
jgi:hypothetical protein